MRATLPLPCALTRAPHSFTFVMPVLVTGIHGFSCGNERRGLPACAGHDAPEEVCA
jgi:hypothetical protein